MPSAFDNLAPRIMADLARDIPEWDGDPHNLAAPLGNLGHESNGFRVMQEQRPTVKGSRGGYGWGQWTGARRRQFEAWCKARGLSVDSYEGNYGFLLHELRTTEKKAVAAVASAVGLEAKVKAFELAFERAGIKHYAGRINWAKKALALWNARKPKPPKPAPGPATFDPSSPIIVRGVQRALIDLGFPQVGVVDGFHGSKTSGAISAYQHDRGLPKTGEITEALIADLDKAKKSDWKRPIAPERTGTTQKDLRDGGSRIAQESFAEKVKGAAVAGGAAVVGTIKAAGEKIEELAPIMSMLDSVPGWCWAALVFVAAATSYYAARRISRARLDDHRSGKTQVIGPVAYSEDV